MEPAYRICGEYLTKEKLINALLHRRVSDRYQRTRERNEAPRSKLRGICGILRSRQPYFAKATKGSTHAFIPVASCGVFGEVE